MADTTDTKQRIAAQRGRRVQRARKAAELTVSELAEMVGISRQAVAQIERGQVTARRPTFAAIALALNVPLARLLG